MRLALAEANLARAAGEVPIGAVVVKDGVLVGSGRNSPVARHDPSAHAEVNALRAAGAALGNYRLDDCELFVTLEPCPMCAGAMLHARVKRVVFGAADPKTGAAGSVVDLFAPRQLNHQTSVKGGVLAPECQALLQSFFQDRRNEARSAAEPLRDDALRTPIERFSSLPNYAFGAKYVSDLPALQGWRMHYLDEGPQGSKRQLLCIHGPGEWSYFFRHLACLHDARVLAPDLIGFGMSDKPKREGVHRLEWHRDVLLEWIERVSAEPMVLVHSAGGAELAQALIAAAPARFLHVMVAPDAGENVADAWRAPFPDRGHEAALRAFGRTPKNVSGPDSALAVRVMKDAMGYFSP